MKKIIIVLLLPLLFVSVSGCKRDKLKEITLAEVTHSVFYAPQYVAINNGYFEEEGLKIDLVNAGGADKVMAALLSGDADVGFSGPEATIYVYNNCQQNYMINFALLTVRDGSFICGRTNEEFTLESLRGKSILGGRLGGVPEMALEYAIKKYGLGVSRTGYDSDVYVRTDVQFNAMAGAFINGEGDYTTLFEPTATQLEKAGKLFVLAPVGDFVPDVAYTSYYVTKEYLQKNAEVVEKFTRAIYKGQQFVLNNSDEEVAKALHKTFNELTLDELTKVVSRYRAAKVWNDSPIFDEKYLTNLMDIMKLAGELDKEAPFNVIVKNDIAKKVVG